MSGVENDPLWPESNQALDYSIGRMLLRDTQREFHLCARHGDDDLGIHPVLREVDAPRVAGLEPLASGRKERAVGNTRIETLNVSLVVLSEEPCRPSLCTSRDSRNPLIGRSSLTFKVLVKGWCPGEDSNLHASRR